MRCFYRHAAVALFVAVLVQAGALARQSSPFKPFTKDGHPYSVRQTVGMHETSGWEHRLTSKDPSLRHWTWLPIYSYDQVLVSANGRHSLPVRPRHVYVKPNHIPLPVVYHEPAVVTSSRYVKPNCLPLPVVEHPTEIHQQVSFRPGQPLTAPSAYDQGDVSARLRQPAFPKPAARTAVIKRYGAYKDVYGRLAPPAHYGNSLAAAHLHGKLICPKSLY